MYNEKILHRPKWKAVKKMGQRERLQRLREEMQQLNQEACLIHKAENIRYLSGFTGGTDGILFVSETEQILLTDGRYVEQAQTESPEWKLVEIQGDSVETLKELCQPYQKVVLEAHAISWQQYLSYQARLGVSLEAGTEILEKMRAIKEPEEIACLKGAARAGDETFSELLSILKPGMTEMDVANQIVLGLKKHGCSGESFSTIAISGPKTALPHGQPDHTPLKEKDTLLMDYGGFFQGYAGDMTRTVVLGEPNPLFYDRYQAVLEAQLEGLQTVKAGVLCSEVDRRVRKVLEKYGLEQYYVHATGHGVGLEIHEAPRVGSRSNTLLKENMAVTVEPGIYIPGWGGIRIEDTVLVQSGGCEPLTHSSKELIVISQHS